MKTLYALLGAPGVGKTTFIRDISREIYNDERLTRYVIGPDLIRSMVQSPGAKPDGTFGISQENEKYVWGIVNDILDKKTEKGEMIIVDATHSRNKAISAYKKFSDKGYRIVLIDFSDYVSLEETLRRNRERESFKFVPEHVVETMHERIQDLDIPSWVEVIRPDEFRDHLTDIQHDWSNFKEISFIGDIHGCPQEFQTILDRMGIDINEKVDERAIVFIGDYFDRGPDKVKVFRMLQELKKNYFVLPLIGNHEEPLEFYKDFMKAFDGVVQQWIKSYVVPRATTPMTTTKVEPTTWSKWAKWKQAFTAWRKDQEYVQDVIEPKATDGIEENAVKLCKQHIGSSYKKLDKFIEDLRQHPKAFKAFEELVFSWDFKEANFVKNTARNTFRAFVLSDIKYTEISQFYKGLAQFCYISFPGQTIVATHGGLADLPSKLTPTADLIRGVGGYEDTLQCDETHYRLNPDVISIHGHRNTEDIPIESTPMTYNINGDVDLGMRAITIDKDGVNTFEVAPSKKTVKFARAKRIKQAQRFKAKKLTASEEGGGLIRLFQDHTHVDVKRLPHDIASINFTRKAFEKGFWDATTVKARGLFLDIDTHNTPLDIIIARGYEKFFNLGERHGISQKDVRFLTFPILAFEKANGYLGILSVDNRDPENPTWFTASKTTTQGDYADNFRSAVEPHLNPGLMNYMIDNNVTLLFEVIDPDFDPHIQTYLLPELVLLDAIVNELQFKKLGYSQLGQILKLMTPSGGRVRVKNLVQICDKASDFNRVLIDLNSQEIFSDDGHEGYVFEDSSPEPVMFKVKSKWYSFWKNLRSTRDRVHNHLKKHHERGHDVRLTKSEMISFKARLHTAEDIKAYKTLVTLAEASPQMVKDLTIPDLRKAIIAMVAD